MTESGYPPDLTTPQWELLQPLLPTAKGGARPPADRRRVFNGRLYLTRAGCAWRRRPHDFGPWQTMYGYLRNWKRTHHWKILHDTRRDYVRVEAGQRTQPTAAMLDSQTVRSADHAGPRGYDGAKKSRGASDIFWWTPCGGGSGSPRPRWPSARARAGYWGRRGAGLAGLRCLWADPGYNGPELGRLVSAHRTTGTLRLEVVPRLQDQRGFVVLATRWIVERTFGWFMKQRCLVRDYETQPEHAEAMIYVTMIGIKLRRLASSPFHDF